MSNNIDFKELWSKQETAIPETKDIFKKANRFKKVKLYKLVLVNILLLSTSVFIGFIWHYYQPELMTTKIGIILIIFAMILFLMVYNRIIPLLIKKGFNINSSQYLQQLLKLKERQLFLQTTMMNIYFLLISVGVCLYMFEYVSRMNIVWAILSYGIILIWIGINWIYFRPRTIKKEQNKINNLISKFKELKEQLTD